jgi:TonB family protein
MSSMRLLRSTLLFLAAASLPPASVAAETPAPPELIPPQVILTSQTVPVFPPAAKAGRFSGTVMLETTVLADGKVGNVKVLDCSRPKVGFEEAAIAAVKTWRFEPGRRAGEPVEYSLRFRLNFAGAGDVPRVSAGSFTEANSAASASVGASSGGGK